MRTPAMFSNSALLRCTAEPMPAGLPTIDTLGVRGGNLHREDEWVDLDGCLLLADDPFEGLELGDDCRWRLSDAAGLGVAARP